MHRQKKNVNLVTASFDQTERHVFDQTERHVFDQTERHAFESQL